MATFVELATQLAITVRDLLVIMSGARHGILQGSHEAAFGEAQGAQIGPTGFNHLRDVTGTGADILRRENALNNVLNSLAGEHPNLGVRVRAVLSPLLRQSASYRGTIAQTEQMAAELAQHHGTRLQGVVFGSGGAGPEVGRTTQALLSTQMQQRAAELAGRGISEPTRLIPSARSGGQQVMTSIRQLPMSIKDAAEKMGTVIGAMRVLATQAARQAAISSNFALAQALNSVERALARASASITRLGGGLSSPIIVINMREIKRQLGIVDIEDGA